MQNDIELMLPDSYQCAKVPRDVIRHPRPCTHGLVLCRNYQMHAPRACTRGSQCRFVHADLDHGQLDVAIARSTCHINFSWRAVEFVAYEKLPAGDTLLVYGPNMREPVEVIPSEYILATRGSVIRSESGRHSHCAHYYFNRLCLRGADCNFIHAVHIDPTAADFQRAPVTYLPPVAPGGAMPPQGTAQHHGSPHHHQPAPPLAHIGSALSNTPLTHSASSNNAYLSPPRRVPRAQTESMSSVTSDLNGASFSADGAGMPPSSGSRSRARTAPKPKVLLSPGNSRSSNNGVLSAARAAITPVDASNSRDATPEPDDAPMEFISIAHGDEAEAAFVHEGIRSNGSVDEAMRRTPSSTLAAVANGTDGKNPIGGFLSVSGTATPTAGGSSSSNRYILNPYCSRTPIKFI